MKEERRRRPLVVSRKDLYERVWAVDGILNELVALAREYSLPSARLDPSASHQAYRFRSHNDAKHRCTGIAE